MIDALSISISSDELAIVTEILRRHLPGCRVLAFGSRVRKNPKPYSDLDLAIVADRPLTLAEVAALKDDFSESDLPWKVDIVDWTAISPDFRNLIEQEYEVIQQAPRSL